VAREFGAAGMGRKQAEERGIEPQQRRRERPHGMQDHLALEVVPHLDVLLVFVRRPIDLVITLRLEEEVAGLTAHHGHQPPDQRRLRRIRERGDIGDDEADRTQQMQRLIDTAVMIVAMVVPSLSPQFRPKTLHGGSFQKFDVIRP